MDPLRVVVYNLEEGSFDVYDMLKQVKIRTIVLHVSEDDNVPVPVQIIHDSNDMLLGSASGTVQIVDVISPIVQILPHPGDMIQALV
ncbi:hypothetical protein EIP86_005774 [Pleurotus ostreatoroseus]|nr:hypothetical protein EIP86_005774 [Pleurotus ostreatoroseus]